MLRFNRMMNSTPKQLAEDRFRVGNCSRPDGPLGRRRRGPSYARERPRSRALGDRKTAKSTMASMSVTYYNRTADETEFGYNRTADEMEFGYNRTVDEADSGYNRTADEMDSGGAVSG